MKIEGEGFILESCKAAPAFFDVSINVTVNEGKENERVEMQTVAYGVTMFRALDIIATSKVTKDTTIEKYLTDYKAAVDSLLLLAKDLENVCKEENKVYISETSEMQEVQEGNEA
jgi:hypothetical protein